jgi:hypothetical protein
MTPNERTLAQKLIDIGFEMVALVTGPKHAGNFQKMSQEERMAWVALQYKNAGFPTHPCGASWGVLDQKKAPEDKEPTPYEITKIPRVAHLIERYETMRMTEGISQNTGLERISKQNLHPHTFAGLILDQVLKRRTPSRKYLIKAIESFKLQTYAPPTSEREKEIHEAHEKAITTLDACLRKESAAIR